MACHICILLPVTHASAACHICISWLFVDFWNFFVGLHNCQWWHSLTQCPLGSGNFSSEVFGRVFKYYTYIFSTWMFTCDVSCEILTQNWQIKFWRIYGHLPNSPMFSPAKVSLYAIIGKPFKIINKICRGGF